MPGLRLLRHRAPDRDRGALAATVAIVLGTGVLLGMAAIVVDVGGLYAEREQLQSGADAAAWAVAEVCAAAPASCAGSSTPTAKGYADNNAADGFASVDVCGRGQGASALPVCPAEPENRTACLGDRPDTGRFVEVRTTTLLRDGETTLLPPRFARALAGGAGEGTTVAACARAAWGSPLSGTGTALTFSTCEWNMHTGSGTTLWPATGTPPQAAEKVIFLKGSGDGNNPCDTGHKNGDGPGDFGWLMDPQNNCQVAIGTSGDFDAAPGSGNNQPCNAALGTARQNRTVLSIPLYDLAGGHGQHTYLLAGFAAFVVTGYNLTGGDSDAPSNLTTRTTCSTVNGNSERCLFGYFVRHLVGTVGDIGANDFGVSIVKLIG